MRWIVSLIHSACVVSGDNRVTHVDLYVLAQTREAIHELAFREATKLAAKHAGEFGLWNAEQRCSFDLSQPLLFQDFADFADELSFDEQAAGRRASAAVRNRIVEARPHPSLSESAPITSAKE